MLHREGLKFKMRLSPCVFFIETGRYLVFIFLFAFITLLFLCCWLQTLILPIAPIFFFNLTVLICPMKYTVKNTFQYCWQTQNFSHRIKRPFYIIVVASWLKVSYESGGGWSCTGCHVGGFTLAWSCNIWFSDTDLYRWTTEVQESK